MSSHERATADFITTERGVYLIIYLPAGWVAVRLTNDHDNGIHDVWVQGRATDENYKAIALLLTLSWETNTVEVARMCSQNPQEIEKWLENTLGPKGVLHHLRGPMTLRYGQADGTGRLDYYGVIVIPRNGTVH